MGFGILNSSSKKPASEGHPSGSIRNMEQRAERCPGGRYMFSHALQQAGFHLVSRLRLLLSADECLLLLCLRELPCRRLRVAFPIIGKLTCRCRCSMIRSRTSISDDSLEESFYSVNPNPPYSPGWHASASI